MRLLSAIKQSVKHLSLFFILLSALFLSSCGTWPIDTSQPYPSPAARLLFYIHSTSASAPDVDFTISGIDLETNDGRTVKVADNSIHVSARELASGQMLLSEAAVKPAAYRGIKITISEAYIRRNEGRTKLTLPEPGGVLSIRTNFSLHNGESLVISLEWDTAHSIEGGERFRPKVEADAQMPSPRGLLLFVSNSKTNYLSIIDRSLERVVAAVTVGSSPMGMALNATQDQLYVVNSSSRTVSVIETFQFRLLSTIALSSGIEPTDIVFMPDALSIEGKLYITNRLSNDVTVVSTATGRVLKVIPVGNYPSHIAADSSRKEVYVTNERSNDLTIINTIDDGVVATVRVNRKPTGVTVGKNKLYIFNEGANNISIVSPSLRKVMGTIPLTAPPRRGINGFGGRTFVANTSANTLTFLTSFDVIARTIPVGTEPVGFAIDEVRNRLYVTNYGSEAISLIEPLGERVLKKLSVGQNPYGIVLTDR